MRFLFFALSAALVLSSCTMQQHIHLHDDYSGRYEFSVDFSAMKGFMDASAEEEGEEPKSVLEDMNVDSIVDALNASPGLSNSTVSEVDGKVTFAYDFSDIETLNRTMQESEITSLLSGGPDMGENPTSEASIKAKGKKVTYTTGDFKDAGSGEELQGMGAMMQFNVKMSFDSPIKSVKNKDAVISSDRKSVIVESNFDELLAGEKNPAMVVKLK